MIIKKYTEERPWGKFEQFTHNVPSTVKIITVKPGEELSLQTHTKRDELWRILKGPMEITAGDTVVIANEGDEFTIEKGQKHRMKGLDGVGQVLEIALGDFDENDIVRLEDKYKR